MRRGWSAIAASLAIALFAAAQSSHDSFTFEILGDRTGEAVPGVYQHIWPEMAAEHPAFALSVGDSIQGGNDATAQAEWRAFERIRMRYAQLPLYLTAGNHDVWSDRSAALYVKYSGHGLHYSFNYGDAHFTILDNSRSEELSREELAFLETDLIKHQSQPLKFIVSHRPSWIFPVLLKDPLFKLHELAKKYGVQYVIAGHVHQVLRSELQGVTYYSAPSAGGHLRDSKKYEAGWFFGHTLVRVQGKEATFEIEETGRPYGEKRVTHLENWTGLGALR